MATPGRAQQCRFMAVVICQMMWPWGEMDQWPWGPECQNPFRDSGHLDCHAMPGWARKSGWGSQTAWRLTRDHTTQLGSTNPSGGSVEFPWSPISIYHARRPPCW